MNSYLAQLQSFLITHYNADDLRTLAFKLRVNYDDLGNSARVSARARELVLTIGEKQRWRDLLVLLEQERPRPFSQSHFSQDEAFVEQLTAEFVALKSEQPAPKPASIQQKAGDRSVQIGQNYGQVTVQRETGAPNLVILVIAALFLTLVLLIWYVMSSFTSLGVNELGQAGNPTPTSEASHWVVQPLESVVLPSLAEGHLTAVAARGGLVWLGAEEGLYVWQAGDEDVQRVVTGWVTAVAAHTDNSVWLALTGNNGAQVGRYQYGEEQASWLDMTDAVDMPGFVTKLVYGNERIWVGDSRGNILRFDLEKQQWITLPPPTSMPVGEVIGLALEPTTSEGLWVVGSQAVYHWAGDQWDMPIEGREVASGVVNAVATSVGQRVWFGHANGVTVFQDQLGVNVRQECAISNLPSSLVTDLVTTHEDKVLWLVSRGGLAWLDVQVELLPLGDCNGWQWQSLSEDSFWQEGAMPGNFRLAVDESKGSIWIVRQGTGRVRWLQISQGGKS